LAAEVDEHLQAGVADVMISHEDEAHLFLYLNPI
jgi:hypothetical protein